MYTRKSKGPKTVPCGTPDATGYVDDEFPSSTTVWVRSDTGYARSQTSLFADDCLVYRKVNSTSDSTQLQEDLDNLIKWEQQWQMQFNPDKGS
jgi:hypothetical protein